MLEAPFGEFEEYEAPAGGGGGSADRSQEAVRLVAATSLIPYTFNLVPPSIDVALTVVKLLSLYYRMPWAVPWVVLEHEGGLGIWKKSGNRDGVMQTTQSARDSNIPRIPDDLKRTLLGLPRSDTTPSWELAARLHQEFDARPRQSRQLCIQIAVGVQELKARLTENMGYVALALNG